jgi:membrane protease YdiL (CAAX protease family)
MITSLREPRYLIPLAIYALIIIAILVMKFFIPWPYVTSVTALLMLSVPIVTGSGSSGLGWDLRGVVTGIIVSVVLLLIYTGAIALIGLYTGKSLSFRMLSYTFILVQLLLVALPEEVFFRGYLQNKLGNNLKGVIIVSLLFAIGHFITLCLGGNYSMSLCSQALLTFFPSLVMGYLYLVTGTLWASIIFHFLANVVHIAIGLS